MTKFAQKSFTVVSHTIGRDPQICRDAGGHWVNVKMKRCNNCFVLLHEFEGEWVEHIQQEDYGYYSGYF